MSGEAGAIRAGIAALDRGRGGAVETAREALVPFGARILPFVAEGHDGLCGWEGRRALVYTCIKFARQREEAVALGLKALGDRSAHVRSMACMLLAYALRRDTLGPLREALGDRDPRVRADAAAAIAAIEAGDHHLYLDRDGTGRLRWSVAGGEEG